MIFPNVCVICGRDLVRGEKRVCMHCVLKAPVWMGSCDDLRAHRMPRTAPVEAVLPWLVYTNEDPFCNLIRRGKFNDRPDIIEELARRYARKLMAEGRLVGIEALVPIPMHWWKRLLRGYNQSHLIAEAISRESGIPVVNALKAVRAHSVQSRKSGEERVSNVKGIFSLRANHKLENVNHIAIVDDILTTGSTVSEGIGALSGLPLSKITVLTLAATPGN